MIRLATESDIPRILVLGRRFFDEAGWPAIVDWDDRSTRFSLEALIEKGVLLVAEEFGQIVGMTGATIAPAYFNFACSFATEVFWYIEPGRRNGIGRKLLAALESECRDRGADRMIMLSVGHRPSALDLLYARRGYGACERSFIKRL